MSASECPAQNYLQKIAGWDIHSLPRSIFNRTILVIGDSIDRNNVEYSCRLAGGKYTAILPDTIHWPQPAISVSHPADGSQWRPNEYSPRSYPAICHIESIDLLLLNVFHFGLDEEEYFTWKDQYGPPYRTDDRVKEIVIPLVQKIGRKVDLVEFASGVSFSHLCFSDP